MPAQTAEPAKIFKMLVLDAANRYSLGGIGQLAHTTEIIPTLIISDSAYAKASRGCAVENIREEVTTRPKLIANVTSTKVNRGSHFDPSRETHRMIQKSEIQAK
jgi:hypothetical protein